MARRATRPAGRAVRGLLGLAVALAAGLVVADPAAPPSSAAFYGTKDGRIAFVRNGNIFTINPNKTGLRRLTTAGGFTGPKWSPDGTRLVYEKAGYLWTMNADGSAKTRHWRGTAATWLRDDVLIYHGTTATPDCFETDVLLTRPLGGGPSTTHLVDDQNLTHCEDQEGTFVLYPSRPSYDGRHSIWFPYQIFRTGVLPVPTPETVIGFGWDFDAESPTVFSWLSWGGRYSVTIDAAPASDTVAVATDAPYLDGRGRLYQRSGDQTRVKRQLGTDLDVSDPVFSPTERQVLYSQRVPGSAPRIRRIGTGPAGTPTTFLTNAEQPDWQPAFS